MACGLTRLKYRVDLAAIFEDFPGTDKPGRYHEAVTAAKLKPLALLARKHDLPPEQMAKLVLGVAHDPTTTRCLPHAGKELLRGFVEVVPYGELRVARQQALAFGYRALRFDRGAKGDDAWCGHGHPSVGPS